MEDLQKKTETYYLCGKCEKELKIHGNFGDIFGNLFFASPMYCENKECEDFGYLKMVGIKKEREVTKK